jgi:hypothetical protein
VFQGGNKLPNGLFTYNVAPEIIDAFRRDINCEEVFSRLVKSSKVIRYQKPTLITAPFSEHSYLLHYSPPFGPKVKEQERRLRAIKEYARVPAPNSFAVNFITNYVCELSGGFIAGTRLGDRFILVSGAPSPVIPSLDYAAAPTYVIKDQPGLLRATGDYIPVSDNSPALLAGEMQATLTRALLLPPTDFRLALASSDANDKNLAQLLSDFEMCGVIAPLLVQDSASSRIVRTVTVHRFRLQKTGSVAEAASIFKLPNTDRGLDSGDVLKLITPLAAAAPKLGLQDPLPEKARSALPIAGEALATLDQQDLVFFTAPALHDPSITIVGCVPVPPQLLPYLIHLYYWLALKTHRLCEVAALMWDKYAPKHSDLLAAAQLPSYISPSIGFKINNRKLVWAKTDGGSTPGIRRIGEWPESMLNLPPLLVLPATGTPQIQFIVGVNSTKPPCVRPPCARYRFHVLKISPFLKASLLTQSSNLTGHGLNIPFMHDPSPTANPQQPLDPDTPLPGTSVRFENCTLLPGFLP